MKKILLLYIAHIFIFQISFGQEVRKANKLYNDFGYKSSVSIYEEKLLSEKINLAESDIRQIANSYRLFHDTQNAEKWYAQLIDITSDPVDYLYYAQVLHSNGNLQEARKYYLLYDKYYGDEDKRGQILADAINRMDNFKRKGVTIKNESELNSKKIEFSPTFYGNGLVFVTTKSPGIKSKKDVWLDDNFMSLFYSEKDKNGNLKEANLFDAKLSSKFHEGPVSFSKTGDQIFFTKSNFSKGKRTLSEDGVLKLQIFSAVKKGNKWGKHIPMPFNNEESDEVHPSLSADGQHLYFASNRDGGLGGMDLYVSEFENGKWSEPVNLGPSVNTPGNEIFPFVHDDGTLYFSSDGHPGLGGLDIYSTVNFEDTWNEPVNMGDPINSNMDDLGFIINVLNSEGYFSSDRSGGIGKDDIYSFQIIPEELKKPIVQRLNAVICTIEKVTDVLIPNVTLRVSENIHFNDSDDQVYLTNSKGEVNIQLDPEKVYAFRTEKNGYLIGEKTFSTEGLNSSENIAFCIGMKPVRNNCIDLKGIVTNAFDGSRIPNATINITNNCTGQMITLNSNLIGEFSSTCLACNCSYNIKGLKSGYVIADETLDLNGGDCNDSQPIYYNIQLHSENSDPSIAGNSRFLQSDDPSSLNPVVGTTIGLDDIYYDFDDHRIRSDAALILDQLAGFMRTYPNIEIELSAHTDSRGTEWYNNQLSAKRAEAAKSYLISNGIADLRISTKGFGENVLRNHCSNNVTCSERQHQYNRRTEVLITSVGEEALTIQYPDNQSTNKLPLQKEAFRPSNIAQAQTKRDPSFSQLDMEYRIQIISSISPDRDFSNLIDLGSILQESVPGHALTRYLISNQLSFNQAQNLLPVLRSRGIKKPFIVSYNNGVRSEIIK